MNLELMQNFAGSYNLSGVELMKVRMQCVYTTVSFTGHYEYSLCTMQLYKIQLQLRL